MPKRKAPREKVYGRYTPTPHDVLESIAFIGCSVRAKAMIFELLRQHNGYNNGHFQLALKYLQKRGWKSADQIQKAKTELINRGLIIKTKLGGLSIGPDWYALTWLDITDFSGLDIRPKEYHRGGWQLMNKLPPPKRVPHSAIRNNTIPQEGMDLLPSVPPAGSLKGVLNQSATPQGGNNECCQFQGLKKPFRIVGKSRKGVPNVEKMH